MNPSSSLRRDTLPLRTPGGSDFPSSDQLPIAQTANSFSASPLSANSPTETEFASTPIEASFSDRITLRADDSTVQRSQGPSRMPYSSDHTRLQVNPAMSAYARQNGDHVYDSDAEADDEFERSVYPPSGIPGAYEDDQSDLHSESEDEHDSIEGGDTPTTQGWADRDGRSPIGIITQWTEEDVADFLTDLSPQLRHYSQRFIEEGITGSILVTVKHDLLRELGIASVGHRLTILKAVYEQKLEQGVKVEEEDYVPLSAEAERGDYAATQDDITRLIESIRLRDQRLLTTEAELRSMRQDLDRIVEENRKLREETLPIMRIIKDQRTPLPDPSMPSPRDQSDGFPMQGKVASSLSRKFSNKKLSLSSTQNQPSPTYPSQALTPQPRELRDDGSAHLEASAAALAASSHLTASMTSQASPSSLSPTSPAYSVQAPNSANLYIPPNPSTGRSFPPDVSASRHNARNYGHADESGIGYTSNSQWSQNNAPAPEPQSARSLDRSRRQAPINSPREEDSARHREGEKENPQLEALKSFRVSIDDPCRVVLPIALKRYNLIVDDWRQYALYIVHGDQERCLGLEEKPLLLFKQLDKEGRKPMFMLRRHAAPQVGFSHGLSGAGSSHDTSSKPIPGGVL